MLAKLTKGNSSTEIAHQLFSNRIEAADSLCLLSNKRPPKSRPYVLRAWNDLKAINAALYHLRRNAPIPPHIS